MIMRLSIFSQHTTFPSLSGTFCIPSMPTRRPKMQKEPSSPSRPDTQRQPTRIKQKVSLLCKMLIMNNAQHLTAGILNCRAEGLLMLVHLAIFRVTRHESALKRQLRIPANVMWHTLAAPIEPLT
jgi:hypothetical protein